MVSCCWVVVHRYNLHGCHLEEHDRVGCNPSAGKGALEDAQVLVLPEVSHASAHLCLRPVGKVLVEHHTNIHPFQQVGAIQHHLDAFLFVCLFMSKRE